MTINLYRMRRFPTIAISYSDPMTRSASRFSVVSDAVSWRPWATSYVPKVWHAGTPSETVHPGYTVYQFPAVSNGRRMSSAFRVITDCNGVNVFLTGYRSPDYSMRFPPDMHPTEGIPTPAAVLEWILVMVDRAIERDEKFGNVGALRLLKIVKDTHKDMTRPAKNYIPAITRTWL